MFNRLMRFFRIKENETKLVFVLGFALMVNALAMKVSGIVAVSGFLSSGGC